MEKSSQTTQDGNGEVVSLRIDRSTRDQLERLAKRNERTLSGEIRHALRLHLERAA